MREVYANEAFLNLFFNDPDVYEIKFETQNNGSRETGFYIAEGHNITSAIQDAFDNYPGLRETHVNTIDWKVIRKGEKTKN